MRPRHKAAENVDLDVRPTAVVLVASMRPRHKAAENPASRRTLTMTEQASMRPRHKAAENAGPAGLQPWPRSASMRPRHKAAENGLVHQSSKASAPRLQ